jgi:hypothetical protein
MNRPSGYPVIAERCQEPGPEGLATFLAETDHAVEILSSACGMLIRALPITHAVLTVPDAPGVNRAVAGAGPDWSRAPPGVGDNSNAIRVPLSVEGRTLGCFELYPIVALDDDHLEIVQDCAAVTAHLIHGILRHRQDELTVAQHQHALASRIVIEQAKGMIAHRDDISPDEAFEGMRRYSRNHNLKIHELARQIVGSAPATDPGGDPHVTGHPA